MAGQATSLDLHRAPEQARLVEQVRRARTPIVLRQDGAAVAVLSPARPVRRRRGKQVTQADIDAARATFGAWKGHIDAEHLKRTIKESRSDHRPTPRL
jgi:hypothetical protein